METGLQAFRRDIGLIWWLVFDIEKFDVYERYINIGLLPKYAYEQAKKDI